MAAEPEVVDRIVAVVGQEIILLSELDEEVYLAHLRRELDLEDNAAVEDYRTEILGTLVDGKLLIEEARRQGIRSTRDDVDRAVESMVADVRSRFASAQEFERQLAAEGTSVEELERNYRAKVEDQLIVRQLVDRTVRSRVTVQDREVNTYWDENRDTIPAVPARLKLRRILVSLTGSESVDSVAAERAGVVHGRLLNGEKFGTLARAFSEGPAAARGGELGWFKPDDLDPALRDSIRDLKPGDFTGVVMTARGAHVLLVDDVRDDGSALVRQIVFLRDEEAARAQARARVEHLRSRLLAGEDFATLAASESDDAATAALGGELGEIPLEALDTRYRDALAQLTPGDISQIVEDSDGFTIFRVDSREGERDPTLDEVRDRIIRILEQEKGEELYEELLADARADTYVELRLDSES